MALKREYLYRAMNFSWLFFLFRERVALYKVSEWKTSTSLSVESFESALAIKSRKYFC